MHNILTDCYAYSKETFSKTARLNCPPGSRSSVPGALEETKKECDPAKTCHNLKMLLAAMRNSALLLLLFNAVGHGAASDRVEEMGQIDGSQTAEYGFGASYPINSYSVSQSDLPDKQAFYDDLMDGCRKSCQYCTELCNDFEKDRIAMSIRQPQSMQNYTDLGIMKIRAPESLMKLLTKFWEDNKGLEYPEEWGKGNVYVNHWEMPSYMLSCEDEDLKGGGPALRTALWDAAIDTVSEWTGQALTTSSLYGIRVYKEGAVLAPHVDRMPLVSSAIINVAQDVDEPWPLEVYTHDGKIHNITMEPGDLVLYESHSVIPKSDCQSRPPATVVLVTTRHLLECIGEGQCSYMHIRCDLQAPFVAVLRPLDAGLSVFGCSAALLSAHSHWVSSDDEYTEPAAVETQEYWSQSRASDVESASQLLRLATVALVSAAEAAASVE